MRYTTGTTPVAIRKRQLCVDHSAPTTRLRRGVVALYLSEHYTAFVAHVAKNLNELAKGKVGDLPTPELLHTLEAQILDTDQIKVISLDRYGFDYSFSRARKHELESAFPDTNPIAVLILPTGLRQRETAVLRPLFEAGQSDLRALTCLVVKECLIGQVQALDHHLSSLGAHLVPVLKAVLFLQLRQMALQLVVAWIGAIEAIVPARQGDEVIPDLGSVLNTFRQKTIVPGSVQAVFECASQLRQKGSALTDAYRRVVVSRERLPGQRTHKGTHSMGFCSLAYYSHALSTEGSLDGSRLSVKKRVCEPFFHRRIHVSPR